MPKIDSQVTPTHTPHPRKKHVDPIRGLWQGIVVGFAPVFTRPFDKVQLIITTSPDKLNWVATLSSFKNQPYKGLLPNIAVTMLRRSIIFATIPSAQNYLQDSGYSVSVSKNVAPAIAGATEALLMAPYTVIDQCLQTGKARTITEAWKNMSSQEYWRKLPISCTMGTACGATFWFMYSYVLDGIEKQIRIKQDSYILKTTEELITGAVAGVTTSCVTYPLYTTMLRMLDNPSIGIMQDCSNAVKKYGTKVFSEHYYKGFSTGLVRVAVGMSAVNGLSYVANLIYDGVQERKVPIYQAASGLTFFSKAKENPNPVIQHAQKNDDILRIII